MRNLQEAEREFAVAVAGMVGVMEGLAIAYPHHKPQVEAVLERYRRAEYEVRMALQAERHPEERHG